MGIHRLSYSGTPTHYLMKGGHYGFIFLVGVDTISYITLGRVSFLGV